LPTPDTEKRARRTIIAFAGLGIVSYAIALVATLPASVVFKNHSWRTGVAGTIWNGEVGVAGGSTVQWSWSPLRSLTSLGFAADWKATGPDTDLGGRVLAGFTSTTLDSVSGSADASILQAVMPALPFTCDTTLQIELRKMVIGGGSQMMDGRIASDPGACRAKRAGAGADAPVPALILTADKIGTESRIRVAPMAQRRQILVEAKIGESGGLDLTVTPDGATMLPFLGAPPGARIQGQM
jgi:hypothetical protein